MSLADFADNADLNYVICENIAVQFVLKILPQILKDSNEKSAQFAKSARDYILPKKKKHSKMNAS